jgi:hypothetical protein
MYMRQYFIRIFLIANFVGLSNAGSLFAAFDRDTVIVTPAKPTTNDSLLFSFHGIDHSCCTQFYNKKVSITDSSISLFASYDDANSAACMCLMAGFNTAFSCQSIKPGAYKIFFSEGMYCPPGKICVAIELLRPMKQVGEIIVRPTPISPTGIVSENKKYRQKTLHPIVTYSSAEKKLMIRITKPQLVEVTAYIVNGEKSTQLSSRKFLQAGTHSFSMDDERFSSGVAVIHVKGESFSEVKMINFAK